MSGCRRSFGEFLISIPQRYTRDLEVTDLHRYATAARYNQGGGVENSLNDLR